MIDYIIAAVVVAVIFFAGRKALKDLKQGKCAGCSCSAKKAKQKPVNIEF